MFTVENGINAYYSPLAINSNIAFNQADHNRLPDLTTPSAPNVDVDSDASDDEISKGESSNHDNAVVLWNGIILVVDL